MGAPPQVLRRHATEIDAALATAFDRLLPPLEAMHPAVGEITAELRAFASLGKRIRPVLLLLGFEAAGGRNHTAVHGPALALELLHTCALAHDDVIDRADTRRGRPTVHRAVARRHANAGWPGDTDAYGEAVAILLGDLAFTHADELFLEAQVPDRVLLAAFRRFTLLREEVMVGQYLDLHAATSRTDSRELTLTVATLKSGRYSVARPLEIGALLAGADDELVAGLGAFGDPLGRAFQVRDDLLGVFGDEAATGKSATSDLAEGKRTLLITEALARLDDTGRAQLEAALGDPTLELAEAARVRELLEACGARDAVERYVHDEVALAREALGSLELAPGAGAALEAVANYLGDRSS